MKTIYLAGSFAHTEYVRTLAERIRTYGHHVYCFCDEHEFTFALSKMIRVNDQHLTFTPQSALDDKNVCLIGMTNWHELAKSDVVILALPCGKSAHLEAGWAKAKGQRVYVYGEMLKGDFDAMYVMVDNLFSFDEFEQMMVTIGG